MRYTYIWTKVFYYSISISAYGSWINELSYYCLKFFTLDLWKPSLWFVYFLFSNSSVLFVIYLNWLKDHIEWVCAVGNPLYWQQICLILSFVFFTYISLAISLFPQNDPHMFNIVSGSWWTNYILLYRLCPKICIKHVERVLLLWDGWGVRYTILCPRLTAASCYTAE